MLTLEEASPWLQSNKCLLPDELAIFVTDEKPNTDLPCQKIVAPVLNRQNQSCLLSGFLIQLGEKTVAHADQVESEIQCHDVQLCSFTLWASDFTAEQWAAIQAAPVRQTKMILDQDGVHAELRSPFGRTFHKDKVACKPEQSTSIQFHAQVKLTELRPLLKRSGFNHVFTVPKGPDNRPAEGWRVVWIDWPEKRIETHVMPHPAIAGLVRGRRTAGVRCESKYFDKTWALFHGDAPPPEPMPQGDVYKIQNLPYGIDRVILKEWLQFSGWEASPMKSIGSRAWLVKAPKGPPRDIMTFNSEPVIVRKLQSMQTTGTGLVAGPRSSTKPASVSAASMATSYRTGDPNHDPWKEAAAAKFASSSTQSKPSEASPGPTMLHLNQHDQQLAALETAFQQFRTEQQETNQQMSTRMDTMDTSLQSHAAETKQTLQDFRQSFQESFHAAFQQNERHLQSSMAEIKTLLQLQRAEKRKKAASAGEEEDDSM